MDRSHPCLAGKRDGIQSSSKLSTFAWQKVQRVFIQCGFRNRLVSFTLLRCSILSEHIVCISRSLLNPPVLMEHVRTFAIVPWRSLRLFEWNTIKRGLKAAWRWARWHISDISKANCLKLHPSTVLLKEKQMLFFLSKTCFCRINSNTRVPFGTGSRKCFVAALSFCLLFVKTELMLLLLLCRGVKEWAWLRRNATDVLLMRSAGWCSSLTFLLERFFWKRQPCFLGFQ